MPQSFGAKLCHLRELRGWTQSDLAERLTISRSALANLEVDRRFPRLVSFVLRTAALFEVPAEYLLNDTIPVDGAMHRVSWPASAANGVVRHFGEKLRRLRTAKGQTQVELTQALALRAQAHISLLEAGQAEPSVKLIMQLARVFDVTADDLLNDTITLG
jgi:transcriptional regulator with XRE-family HTH domain